MLVLVHLGDQRRARTDSHGIINFSLDLVRALPDALSEDDRLVVQVNDEMATELGDGFLRDGDALDIVSTPKHGAARLALDHIGITRTARSIGADAVLYPKGFMPLTARLAPCTHGVCLHDDIPTQGLRDRSLSLPRRVRSAYFTWMLRRSMRGADLRLFVSEFTRETLTRRWPHRSPHDAVTLEGIPLRPRPLVALAERQPQAVMFGSHHPHKRFPAGLSLIEHDPVLQETLERVVVVGPLDRTVRRVGRLEVHHEPGPLEGADLAALIGGSRLLVYPSEYEGFGLPPIEAYALGTPAIYRRNGAAVQVLHGVPGGYETEDADSFSRAVSEVLALDDARLEDLSQEMWRRFDWSAVADRVVEALRRARNPSASTGSTAVHLASGDDGV